MSRRDGISRLIVSLTVLGASTLAACDDGAANRPRAARPPMRPVVERSGTTVPSLSALGREPRPEPDSRVCPGTVAGARTRLANIPDGVEITIAARNRRARDEIRRRAQNITTPRRLTSAESTAARSCLVAYYPGTLAEVEEIPGGVRVRVTAAKPEDDDALRRVIRERAEALAASGGNTGGAAPGGPG
jgi:hypothetical protein